jgi:hypothetical protein
VTEEKIKVGFTHIAELTPEPPYIISTSVSNGCAFGRKTEK